MASVGCSLREHVLPGAFRAITLENQFLAVTLLPEKGADVYALVYKPRQTDVLWKSPWGLKKPGTGIVSTGASTEAAWLEHYEGGWQLLFPNGGDECRYKGAALNFHGEASVLPWDYEVLRKTSASVSVRFTVQLYRSPFRIRRTFTVERSLATVLLHETIENLAEEDLHFMWGQHPAFGAPFLTGGCRLQLPARTFTAHDAEISPSSRIAPSTTGPWPQVSGKRGTVDLSLLPPAHERVTEFGYLKELEEGWYSLSNPALGFGFGLAWPKEIFPYAWFWQELRGSFGYPWYGRCYVMAVEPFTSVPGCGLERAIAADTAPLLAAGAKVEARLAAVLFEGGEVESVTTDGHVTRKRKSQRRTERAVADG
jgi:hypothetical protein